MGTDEYNAKRIELIVQQQELLKPVNDEAARLTAEQSSYLKNAKNLTEADLARYAELNAQIAAEQKQSGDIIRAVDSLWPAPVAGWPPQERMRELLGFTLSHPDGTRASWHNDRSGHGFYTILTGASDQTFQ